MHKPDAFCIIKVGAFFYNTEIEHASYEMYRVNTASLWRFAEDDYAG